MEGWLWKKSKIGLQVSRRRWCTLSPSTLKIFTTRSKDTSPENLRGTIRIKDITEVVLGDDFEIFVACKFRVYEFRAEGDEDSAKWVRLLKKAARLDLGRGRVSTMNSSLVDGSFGIPWMIDGAWIDGVPPCPLKIEADAGPLSALEKTEGGGHTAHVRLSDGSTFSCQGLSVDGDEKDVAVTGQNKLTASLEIKKRAHLNRPSSSPSSPFAMIFTGIVAVTSAATLLSVKHFPDLLQSDLIITILLGYAILALAGWAYSLKKSSLDASDDDEVLLILRAGQVIPEHEHRSRGKSTYDIDTTLNPIPIGGRETPSVSTSSESSSCGLTGENGEVNFSGEFELDLAGSDDPTEMLTALNVPWIARKAIKSSARTLHIEHDGQAWTETIVTTLLTRTINLNLDGKPTVEISPVDKSSVTSKTKAEGPKVVTTSDYGEGSGKSQRISRELQSEGELYVVYNVLTVNGKEILTMSRYKRIRSD